MLITQPEIQALQTSFSTQFRTAMDDTDSWWNKLATPIPSSTSLNTYGWMERLLSMREWIGPRQVQNLNTKAYTLTNLPFEATVGVLRDDIEDDNLGVYTPLMQELGRVAGKWPDQIMRTALQAGATTGLGFDGLSFFNTAHLLNPTAQANNFPGTALNAANYAAVREAMQCYLGFDGEPLGVMPTALIVPPQLEFQGRTIINATIVADGAGAGISNVQQNSSELLVLPGLCNQATTWYLADLSRPIKPLIFQQRRMPQLVSQNTPNADGVFFDRKFIWGVDSRGAAGYSCWWLMARAIA